MNALSKATLAYVLAASAGSAYATGNHQPPAPTPAPAPEFHQKQNQDQSQQQHQKQSQGQNQSQQAISNSSSSSSSEASARSSSTSNATTNATTGPSTSSATGGNSSATGGTATSTNGGISNTNNFEAQKPMGNVAGVTLVPAANCGSGWAMNVSVPFFGVGGGKTDISDRCLSHDAAKSAVNAGLISGDKGVYATGLSALRKLHPEFDAAAYEVIANLKKPCAKNAAAVSVMMLTDETLECSDEYLSQSATVIAELEKPAPAPVIQFPEKIKVEIDGVVKTKEQHTPRKGPARPRQPLQVEIVKMPCDCPKDAAAPAPAPK